MGWELAGMLSNELAATNAFRIVERSKLESVLSEQLLNIRLEKVLMDIAVLAMCLCLFSLDWFR